MSAYACEPRKLMRAGKLFGDYAVVRLLGHGGYGDIYEVRHTASGVRYAMKLESISAQKQALQREHETMRQLASPFFPALVQYAETVKYRYLVMELCGPSFATVRRLVPSRRFSISTVLRSGIYMLRAIEACHRQGILHRDVKPSNFLIRASRRYPLALIDYGLSRDYTDGSRHHGFVGTVKYSSINAQNGRELGRRDDLFSWFYSLIELWKGKLPWSSAKDRQRLYTLKCSTDILTEIDGAPPSMANVYKLIRRLELDEEPEYALMISFMVQAMRECGAEWEDPYEWETMDLAEVSAISVVPDPAERRDPLEGLPPPVMPVRSQVVITRGERDKAPPDQLWIPKTAPTEFAQMRLAQQFYQEMKKRCEAKGKFGLS